MLLPMFSTLGILNLKASYYNCNLSVWEPFIEPWNITLKVCNQQ